METMQVDRTVDQVGGLRLTLDQNSIMLMTKCDVRERNRAGITEFSTIFFLALK